MVNSEAAVERCLAPIGSQITYIGRSTKSATIQAQL